jgi:uncharacterized protein
MSNHHRFAIVTGASSGIGVAYAERMAERGYDLILVARRRDRLQDVARRIEIKTKRTVEIVIADLADAKDLLRIEALLTERDALENLIKINILALTRLTHAALPGFLRRNSGTIINIASMIAVMPTPSGAGYSGSKAYVLNFTRSLQMELAKTSIIVQAILPGPVRTEFFEASGLTAAPFPNELFMSADQLVDTSLQALDQGELVCFPSLENASLWTDFEDARIALSRGLMQSGKPATRYSENAR